ncbi:MAG: single-stranded-DNA-specific exonuclease RecJ [bacterium]|nr:single-stranded-DNA-specific exonuclease RecJ [bacterium]
MSLPRPRPVWVVAPADPEAVGRLRAELGIGRVLATVLAGRGLQDPVEAHRFLHAGLEDLHDPLAMAGMSAAVERIARAARSRERVTVYGDYDVDGLAALTMLVECLGRLGADVDFYVPDRLREGYGINAAALRELAGRGVRLVVTVDSGISAVEEAELAAELGLDLIVTDHHPPGPQLPRARAVLNPRREGCPYPCKHLAGVGVAFKLVQALLAGGGWEDYLELVALGTVADVVPLVEENRLLVRAGLDALARTRRPGLRALLATTRLAGETITPGHVAFALGPRINAAGRVGQGGTAIRLLLATDAAEADHLAAQLERDNRERQALEARVLAEAEAMVAGRGGEIPLCLVLADQSWHPGVLGISASKLVERYHRPVVLLALEGNRARGSARSIGAFNILAALQSCAGILERFGGHPAAAGLLLPADRLGELAMRLEELARTRLSPADLVPTLAVDAEVEPAEIDLLLAEELARLGPCGYGNPTPVLAMRGAALLDCRAVGGDGAHLRLHLGTSPGPLTAIAFGMGERRHRFGQAAAVDLAFTPQRNAWNGRQTVSLHVRDLAVPGGDWVDLVNAETRAVLVLGPDGDWAEGAAPALSGPLVLHARTRLERRLEIYAHLEGGGPAVVVTSYYHGPFLVRRFPSLAAGLGLVVVCDARPAPGPLRWLARDRLLAALSGREDVRVVVAACAGLEEVWPGEVRVIRPATGPAPQAAPDRARLRRAYRALRQGFPPGAVLELGSGKPASLALAAEVGPAMVDATVAVLEELGLVELWPGEGIVRILLNPLPGARVDLAESPSFLEGCAGRGGGQ